MLSSRTVAEGFLAACEAELLALKPGNVHVHAPGHGMGASHFRAAAAAAAPFIADPLLKIGPRIRRAVEASWAAAGCNTNLEILLLCAPLARAAETIATGQALRDAVHGQLMTLDQEDAAETYAAITAANPAGLGTAPREDVHAPPSVTLLEAMRLASVRDRIANAYSTDFADIFEFALPVLEDALGRAETEHFAVTTLHMALLAQFPDSHIARKFDPEIAETVRREAVSLTALWKPVATPASVPPLLAFDAALKSRKLNPGTTADFVVATLFAEFLHKHLSRGDLGHG